jgi:transposase-like protein
MLQAIIRGKASLESVLHTDRWRGYDGLVDLGFDKHLRVNHCDHELAFGSNHINGIESFWSYAKHRLAKFHGMTKRTLLLHLTETGIRFNQKKATSTKCYYQSTEKNRFDGRFCLGTLKIINSTRRTIIPVHRTQAHTNPLTFCRASSVRMHGQSFYLLQYFRADYSSPESVIADI